MSIISVIVAGLLVLNPAVNSGRSPCSNRVSIGDLVPNADVARSIAEVIIGSRQSSDQVAKFVLSVEEDPTDPNLWMVGQALPELPSPGGQIIVRAGGGGLSMRIDKCTAQISDVHYIR
jgi:hypothetical protein